MSSESKCSIDPFDTASEYTELSISKYGEDAVLRDEINVEEVSNNITQYLNSFDECKSEEDIMNVLLKMIYYICQYLTTVRNIDMINIKILWNSLYESVRESLEDVSDAEFNDFFKNSPKFLMRDFNSSIVISNMKDKGVDLDKVKCYAFEDCKKIEDELVITSDNLDTESIKFIVEKYLDIFNNSSEFKNGTSDDDKRIYMLLNMLMYLCTCACVYPKVCNDLEFIYKRFEFCGQIYGVEHHWNKLHASKLLAIKK